MLHSYTYRVIAAERHRSLVAAADRARLARLARRERKSRRVGVSRTAWGALSPQSAS